MTMRRDADVRLGAEEALRASEQRLALQSDALTGLTSRYTRLGDRFEDRLRGILAVGARTLQVERLSMWRLDDDGQAIRCVGMYVRGGDQYQSGLVLARNDAPAYFEALEQDRVVAAHDALTDARTVAFRERYLVPNGIGAMLDVPLRQDDRTIGVLCAEHVGPPRVWTVDEQNFAVSAANLVVVALADDERREALARLADSEARARLIVDTAHDAFIGMNSDGLIVTWNAQAERTFGWSREEALGQPLVELIIPPAFRAGHVAGMARFHETGEAPVVNQRLELSALDRTGREFPIEITITSPMAAAHGYFFGAFLRDISDRRERDAQLHAAKESAEAATRAKSEFLANMSHELRTPLNGVLGYAQLLQRDRSLADAQREAVDAISKCGAHLLELINDVLDLSRIEAGRVDIQSTATDLPQLIRDLQYVVAEAARRKGLALDMTIAPDVPDRLVLDGRHVRQVLLNLLGNAIKFTAFGQVRLVISRVDGSGVLFEVIDTGVGIEAEALSAIFEAFTQTKAGALAGGSGLGLTISHHLVRKMDADLSVESTPGVGSRFFFTLPLVPADASRSHQRGATGAMLLARLAPGAALTALVADDSTVNRRILASLLESAGVKVIAAAGGVEAVQLAREHHPDVVFMDLRMSDLDGLEATRRLRADPATLDIPVIAVTASAFGDTRQAAREAGCVDYLSKPVRAEDLFDLLRAHTGARFVDGDAPPEAVSFDQVEAARRQSAAARLRQALVVGDVTDLEQLSRELGAGSAAEATLGRTIAAMAADFDFEGLGRLAASLTPEGARAGD